MRRRTKWILLVVLVPVAAAVVVVSAVHLPAVQRAAFERVAAELHAATGLEIAAGGVSARLLPARVRLADLEIRSPAGTLAEVEEVEASWSWASLLGEPPRLDSVRLEGAAVDLRNLPAPPEDEDAAAEGADATAGELLAAFEVGRLELVEASAVGSASGVTVGLEGVRVEAGLDDAILDLGLQVRRLSAEREGRVLEVRDIELRAHGGASGIELRRLEVGGDALALSADGRIVLEPGFAADAGLVVEAELAAVVGWWDPDRLDEVDPRGRLRLAGTASWDRERGPVLDLSHRGAPMSLAGFEVASLAVKADGDRFVAEAAGSDWGRATAVLDPDGVLRATLDLERLDVDRAVARAGVGTPTGTPDDVVASGRLEIETRLPPVLEQLTAEADLVVSGSGVAAIVDARVADGAADLRRLEVSIGDARLEARGAVAADRTARLEARLEVPDPAALERALARWLPEDYLELEIGPAGGPLSAEADVDGPVASPALRVEASWRTPVVGGVRLERVDLEAELEPGAPARWRVEAVPAAGATVAAAGATALDDFSTTAEWAVDLPDLAAAAAVAPVGLPAVLGGAVSGAGTAAWSPEGWRVAGRTEARGLEWDAWRIDAVAAELVADPRRVEVPRIEAALYGGTLTGSGSIGLGGLDAPVELGLDLEGVDLAQLPVELPPQADGTAAVRVEAHGTVARPEGAIDAEWTGADPAASARRLEARAALAGGVVELSIPVIDTAAGTMSASGRVPLGDLPRPDWLWPDAPSDPVRLRVAAADLRSTPLMVALGAEPPPVELTTDLAADVRWDLADPGNRFAEVRLEELELENVVETVRSDGPVVLRVDGDRAVVESARLAGARTRIELGGEYLLRTGEIHGVADAVIAPEMARLLPVALQVREPLRLRVVLDGTLDTLTGRIELTHPDGRIVMRDPALAIEDLHLAAELVDGALWIEDGGATVNRGRVELAGGWDPDSGQGIVLALDDVVFLLPYDILTRWSGNLALEPDPERIVNVVGDLALEGGVWDRSVDLTGIVFGPAGLAPPADDPLWEVGLDLDVRGRGGLVVDNNLGEFEVTWGLLEIRGTAAQPVLVGDIRVAPGGQLSLAGREVTVRRGTISFTGSPATDPVVEIVPVDDVAVFGGGAGGGIDTTMAARRGVAQGLGAVLGLENETLRPAEIAIETDTDTTTTFTAGQRITRNVALFLTTDLSDVQDRTTMLQVWNFRQLPGLAVQGWQRTGDDDNGVNVVQRFRWGGTRTADDRDVIHKIRLEGEWPVSKWWFKRKLGIHKGEPYEPFVAFAAGLRLERELAARGWQLARVELDTSGSERSPTLEYRVDPGPRTRVEFVGHEPAKHIRREVTALYQPPPLDRSSYEAMTDLLERYFRSEGYPYADIEVGSSDGGVRVVVDRGRELRYEGPMVEGVDSEAAQAIRAVIGNPSELVALLEEPDRGGQIVQRILHNIGYRQARIERVWAERVGEKVSRVHLEVEAGERAVIRELRVEGDDPLGAVAEQGALQAGEPLDRTRIERAADRVERRYRDAGWIDAEVRVHYQGDDDAGWTVRVAMQPGAPQVVSSIDFAGRRHVSRNALSSGLELREGEVLQLDRLDQSVIEIATFAPIERLGVDIRPAGPGRRAIEFQVEERPRWVVEVGGGWSSDQGIEGRFGISDGGLFGRGGSVSLRGRWRQDEQLALLYASLPPLPGRRISFGSALRWERGESPDNPSLLEDQVVSLTLETTFDLRRGRGIRPYYRLSETTTDLKRPDFILDPFFPQTNVESILGLQLYRDALDNPFDPRSGSYLAFDTNWNSPQLGSDLNDIRSLLTGSLAVSWSGSWTWAQAVRLGIAEGLGGTNLTPQRKFFAGGQASIRGFEKDLVGPVTVDFDGNVVPDGGGAVLVLNEELRIPVWGGLRLAVFADVGQVWESWSEADLDLAVGAGVGIRYATPIGPLWADVAWPVANRGFSGAGARFYFGIGRPF